MTVMRSLSASGSEIEVIHITKDLQRKVKSHIDKNQREYILREQLKTIREELGEENTADDIDEFKKQLKELDASDEVKEKISKEISRFKGMAASAAEATVQRGYLETVLALPWNKKLRILRILRTHGRFWKRVITD